MNAAMPKDARSRLPREPYPGLRPFLDFEAALLFGRERQVREVIERLRDTQFVAVLGGSGSGKSSLIHAGVVPQLRSFGIPDAGDLWLPLTCTPGTNVGAEDSATRRHSPVTRLARRFAALLKSRGSDEADAQRQNEIAEVFRQEAGFARLLDTYGAELAVPPGPDASEARVLFVLDQFEEIFHPTNKGVADASLLVERVLDHFFNPHPHCHVVLTMRSEHLNDCAAYLELPDAINKSSYLIRRLDDDELREAITGPAQRFLRLQARSAQNAGHTAPLPTEVHFEPSVLERLLRDAKAITHDPDHLPLLQHLLARLWEAALEREEMDVPVPSRITEADLARAVSGGTAATPGEPHGLDERVNTLRACVENWPEAIYKLHDEAQRTQLDALFRHLAFKDPNTGQYSQQRIDVDACAALIGAGTDRIVLRALLGEGFLGSVDYLFWDDEDPARVTLKVSHESFIRGWSRFRRLIDAESEGFDEFVGVLRRCAAWDASGRREDLLLETGEMRLLRESSFQQRLARPGQREAWFRFLQLDRDGARLGRQQSSLDQFLSQSVQRLALREGAAKRRKRLALLSVLSVLLVPPAFFSIAIQIPVTQRASSLLEAGNRANRAALTPDYPGVGAAQPPLDSLLRAAELIDVARTGQGSSRAQFSQWLLDRLSWISPVRRQGEFLNLVAGQAEPPVNGKLRQLMGTALWAAAPAGPADEALPLPEPQVLDCQPRADGSTGLTQPLNGRLYVQPTTERSRGTLRRALFVPTHEAGRADAIELRSASFDTVSARCEFDRVALRVPMRLDPAVVIDAGLRYVAYSAAGPAVEVPSVTVEELSWDRLEDKTSRALQTQTRAVITHRDAVAAVQRAAGVDRLAVVNTWRVPGGRTLMVGGQAWRLVAQQALRLPPAARSADFAALVPVENASACGQLIEGWVDEPGFRTAMFEYGGQCFAITRGNPDGSPPAAEDMAAREQVLVAVYERPTQGVLSRLKENPPAPVASVAPFGVVSAGEREWVVGIEGPYAGWLAMRGKDAAGNERLVGVPTSTCALWRLGRELVGQGAAAPAAAGDETCRSR
jgi:hypothetical protein